MPAARRIHGARECAEMDRARSISAHSALTFGSACGARRSRARRRMGSGQAEFLEPAPRLVQAVEQPDRTIALGDSREGLGEAFVVRADNESDRAAHVAIGIAAKRAGDRVDLL